MAANDVRDLFDRAAATYDPTSFPVFSEFGRALAEFARIEPHERVLDVGCGAGAALAPASRVAASAVGIELAPAMAERARIAAPAAEVVVGDAGALPFDDASFDVVLSSFVVFFFDDPTAALREWTRVLAPGGRLVLATWAGGDPRWSWERDVRMPYAQSISPERLREILGGLAMLDRFNDREKVGRELELADLEPTEIISQQLDFRFGSEDDWWDWNWSHGARVFLESLTPDARESFRRDAYEGMQANRGPDGFPRTYTALFARASAAGAQARG